jgi:O-antigen/teichoic acid export membrane protein
VNLRSDGLSRVFWGMSSQIFASAISLALTIFTARAVSATEYGLFSLALTTAFFVTGMIRAMTSEVLVFRYSSATGANRERMSGECLSAGIFLAIVVALLTLGVGLLTSSTLWILVAAALVGLVVQDNVRFVLMAHGRTKGATMLDGLTLVGTVGFLVVATLLGNINWFVVAWGGAAWVSAIFGLLMLKPRLRFRNARAWGSFAWAESRFFAGEYALTNAVSTGSVYFIALLLGAVAAGQIRAASMLVLPILLLTRGMLLAVAAESNRLIADRRFASVGKIGYVMSISAVLITIVWIPLVIVVPAEVLVFLLGDSAEGARAVFPYVALATAAAGVAAGPNLILKSAGQVKTTLLGKIIALPVAAGGVVLFSLTAGVAGSQIGLAIGELLRGAWGACWARTWLKRQSGVSQKPEVLPARQM